jgi:subtilisin
MLMSRCSYEIGMTLFLIIAFGIAILTTIYTNQPVASQSPTNRSNIIPSSNLTDVTAIFNMTGNFPTFNITDSNRIESQIVSIPQAISERENETMSTDVVPGEPIKPIPNSFIVKLKPTENVSEFAATVADETETLGGNITGVYDQLGLLNIQFGEVPSAELLSEDSNATISAQAEQFLQNLRSNPQVEEVYNDAIIGIQAQVLPNAIDRVDGDKSLTVSGNGFGSVDADIAVLDTGVQQNHPDLNVFRCVSFVGNPTPTVPIASCTDGHGHGTHVAGTAAARDNNIGVVGTAPGARIWAVKVLNDFGSGTISDILEGLNYVAGNAGEIDVTNLSLGGIGSFPPLEDAITLLRNRDVVPVVAAGNSFMNALGFTPAKTPAAITVSAILDSDGECGGGGFHYNPVPPNRWGGPDDTFAGFSNHGAIVDMAAPGVDVLSTYKGSGYQRMSGTSMAAPNVAGAAALLIGIDPTLSASEVESILKNEGTISNLCDGNGKGYFGPEADDDNKREPLLHVK